MAGAGVERKTLTQAAELAALNREAGALRRRGIKISATIVYSVCDTAGGAVYNTNELTDAVREGLLLAGERGR